MQNYTWYSFAVLLLISIQLGCQNDSTNDNDFHLVRNAHAIAYNSEDSLVYVFGGANEKEVLDDLLVLKDSHWTRVITETSPQPRTFASMCFDTKNKRLILFGGNRVLFGTGTNANNLLNDTWQFKDNKWQQISIDSPPTARAEMAMAYDENRNVTVLFGGYTIEKGEYKKLGDTWELHDNTWQRVSTNGPTKRNGASMAYHVGNKNLLLYGGSTEDRQYGNSAAATWTWNGVEWRKLQIDKAPGIYNASMAYDINLESMIRFGGWNGESRIAETWMLDSHKWKQLDIKYNPSPRNHSGMVYDNKNGVMILYGGHDGEYIFGDTWFLQSGEWRELISTEAIKRIENEH